VSNKRGTFSNRTIRNNNPFSVSVWIGNTRATHLLPWSSFRLPDEFFNNGKVQVWFSNNGRESNRINVTNTQVPNQTAP